MSDPGKSFELGGIVVPLRAALAYDQQIEPIGASSVRRFVDGSAVKQTVWGGKLRISLSGDGWAPLGLHDLDYTAPLTLKCGTPEAIRGARTYLGILIGTSIGLQLVAVIWTWSLTGTLDFTKGGILEGKVAGPMVAILLALLPRGRRPVSPPASSF